MKTSPRSLAEDRSRAESPFAEVDQRRATEGAGASRRTAAPFRHLGPLAAGQDTTKALPAHRRAAALDPDDPSTRDRIDRLE